MSQSSRSQVTITLGRNGRVVKRGRSATVDRFDDFVPVTGSKRPISDRLGSHAHSSTGNKRQRVDSHRTSLNDMRLGRGDLRYKLLQKNVRKKTRDDSPESDIDLRERLSSREVLSSANSRVIHAPEAKAIVSSEATLNTRQNMLNRRDVSMLRQVPSSRSTSYLPIMDPSRNSYSSWTMDNLRRRSPDRIMRPSTSRGLSPPRNVEELRRRTIIRPFDDGKSNPLLRNEDRSPHRPVSSASYLAKPTLPATTAKHVASFVPQFPVSSATASRAPYSVDDHPTVESLLHSLGLEKYVISFKHEEVDMHALRQMGDLDLKELGIPMGPRKKILQAVARVKRNP